jgi:hypothetical protein
MPTSTLSSKNSDQDSFSDRINVLLEQYKIYVESTDRFTGYRNQANTFFLTLNTVLIGLISTLLESDRNPAPPWYIVACTAGILFSISWYFLVGSYRTLNAARFDVLHIIEEELPVAIYRKEWEILQFKKPKHIPMTHIEQIVPIAYSLLYVIIIVIISR